MVKMLGLVFIGVVAGAAAIEVIRRRPRFIKKMAGNIKKKAAATKEAFLQGYAAGLS